MKYYTIDGKDAVSTDYPGFSATRYINWSEEKKDILPELYQLKEDCCGCFACFSICPSHAIDMAEDLEGFVYPVIDANKCIGCHRCKTICPFKKTIGGIER